MKLLVNSNLMFVRIYNPPDGDAFTLHQSRAEQTIEFLHEVKLVSMFAMWDTHMCSYDSTSANITFLNIIYCPFTGFMLQ